MFPKNLSVILFASGNAISWPRQISLWLFILMQMGRGGEEGEGEREHDDCPAACTTQDADIQMQQQPHCYASCWAANTAAALQVDAKMHRRTHAPYILFDTREIKNSPELQRHGQLHLWTHGENGNFNFWCMTCLFSLTKSIFLRDWSHFQIESSHVQMQLPKLNTCDSQPRLHSIFSTPEMKPGTLSSS